MAKTITPIKARLEIGHPLVNCQAVLGSSAGKDVVVSFDSKRVMVAGTQYNEISPGNDSGSIVTLYDQSVSGHGGVWSVNGTIVNSAQTIAPPVVLRLFGDKRRPMVSTTIDGIMHCGRFELGQPFPSTLFGAAGLVSAGPFLTLGKKSTGFVNITVDGKTYKVERGLIASSSAVQKAVQAAVKAFGETWEGEVQAPEVWPHADKLSYNLGGASYKCGYQYSEEVDIDLFLVDDGLGNLTITSDEGANAALNAAIAAARAHNEVVKEYARWSAASKPASAFPQLNALLTRPQATYSPGLLDTELQRMDAWWASSDDVRRSVWKSYNGNEQAAYDKYVEETGSDIDFPTFKSERPDIGDYNQFLPVPDGSDAEAEDGWWDAIKSGASWLGDNAFDLAKEWGAIGTVGAIGVASGLTDDTFSKYLPWMAAGLAAIVVLK